MVKYDIMNYGDVLESKEASFWAPNSGSASSIGTSDGEVCMDQEDTFGCKKSWSYLIKRKPFACNVGKKKKRLLFNIEIHLIGLVEKNVIH